MRTRSPGRRLWRRVPVALIVVSSLLFAAQAQAEIRSGSGSDAQEAQPDLSGGPAYEDDLQQLRVNDDRNAGTLGVAVRFHFPITKASGYETSVTLATDGALDNNISFGCDFDSAVTLRAATAPTTSVGSFTASGFSGSAPAAVAWSEDHRELLIIATHPALVGRDLRCAEADQERYDEFGHCGTSSCSFISHWYDGDDLRAFWLAGFGPVPTPVPPPTAQVSIHKCSGMVARFFSRITAFKASCTQAKGLIRSWIKRSGFGYRDPKKQVTIGVWRCKLFQDRENPYGRVTCTTKSGKRVKFYG
jgi:hypothetical protein